MLTFTFNGVEGKLTVPEILTSGMVGKKVAFQFSPEWAGIHKNVIYMAGKRRVIRTGVGAVDTIPAEVLEKPLEQLFVGIYGVSTDGTVVIPTIRAEGPVIQPGVDADAQLPAEPVLPIWAQLEALIGDISQLETGEQDNLVDAINAAAITGDGDPGVTFFPSITRAGVLSWTNDGGLENPEAVNLTGPQGPQGATGETGPMGPAGPAGIDGYDIYLRSVAFRGLSAEAPENTLPAYRLAKERGFQYVHCDVRFTADGIAVLLADSTIDRTSDGTGAIAGLDYGDVYTYDFGSWQSEDYAGTKLPTFEEFLILCKKIGLKPDVTLYADCTTQEQVDYLVQLTRRYGLGEGVTWLSEDETLLDYVKAAAPKARLGLCCDLATTSAINTLATLSSGENQVFLSVPLEDLMDVDVQLCLEQEVILEVRQVQTQEQILGADPYISGITSLGLHSGTVLYTDGMDGQLSGGGGELEDSNEYTLYHTIQADELEQMQLQDASPYAVSKISRLSYTPFDLAVDTQYQYLFEYDTSLALSSIAIASYTEAVTERIAAGTSLASITTDSGWLENGVELTFAQSGWMRIYFKGGNQNNGFENMAVGTIGPVRIYRKKVS